ncbi:hypothetical protein AB0M52_34165, partial [Micromonospora sp. NPDC051296]
MSRRPAHPLTAALATATLAAALLVNASGAAAAPGHAPETPTGLTVDDREHPLNVEGPPRFSWLPRDRDPGEVQTAYRITVAEPGGALVWDSGEVASGQQSYVRYAGPALRSGAAYEWSVRTWDRTGQQSPTATGRF